MVELKPHSGSGERRYEVKDVSLRVMVYSGIGLAALVILGLLASWFVFSYDVRVQKLGPPASPFENARTLPPSPRLQVHPAEDLKVYRAEEDTKLNTYGWVDKSAGIVHIPIERAMELSLGRGFPVRKGVEGEIAGGSASGDAKAFASPGREEEKQ